MPFHRPPARLAAAAIALAALVLGHPSYAAAKGDWLLRLGYAQVSPKSDNGSLGGAEVTVDDGASLGVTLSYLLTDHFALGLLGALPFSHEVDVQGLGTVAEVKHLPPTLTAQYRFRPQADVSPYVGAGLNYTTFMDEEGKGALGGTEVSLDSSFGYALEAGVDLRIARDMVFNVSAWYLDIDTTAKTAAGKIDVAIDPWVFFAGVGWRF